MENFSDMFANFMDKNMKNYLNLTILEAYNVLTSDQDPWPNKFQTQKKIKLIDQLIEHFTDEEEYERCAKLVKLKEQVIENAKNSK